MGLNEVYFMNPVVKIITNIIIVINRTIDNLDKKTVETIKQSYYLLIFVIVIVGIIIGYNSGKGSAKKYGKPIADSTDSVFDILIKRERKDVRFDSIMEEETIKELKNKKIKKIEFPSSEKLESEFYHTIIEPDVSGKKIVESPAIDSRDRLAGTDGKGKKNSSIAGPDKKTMIENKKNNIDKESITAPANSGKMLNKNIDLNPIDKNKGIIDK